MIGRVVNNYEIKSLVAEGGMGKVYLAVHPLMGRRAAIKVLRSQFVEDKAMVSRFVNEAKAANAIHHPNIVEIIDAGYLSDGVPYLMMEFLDGETLEQRLVRVGRLPAQAVVAIADQAAAALEAAHAAGIIHRDLKPDNLFLIADPTAPGGERVKLVDFGIAKLTEAQFGPTARTTGVTLGTPTYMAPEQCRGGTQDQRVDVYALGAILYQMLCGRPPFVAESSVDVMMMHVGQTPPPPRVLFPDISEGLESTTLRALRKKPDDRFPSMTELRAALGTTAARLAMEERRGSAGGSWLSPIWRRAWWIALMVMLGAGAAWAGLTFMFPPPESSPPHPVTTREPPMAVNAVETCGDLGTSPCSTCIAANCCQEYQACQGDAACKRALETYNGCMHRKGKDRAAVCSEQFWTDGNPQARALANCAFVRVSGPKVKPGRCADECERDSISDDACAAYCSCMAETCRTTLAPLACPSTCARLTAEQVSCRTYHCALAGRGTPQVHCQHAIGHLKMCE